MVSFDKITDLIGYLVLTEDGAVLESGGELKNDERKANIIMSLLNLTDRYDTITSMPIDNHVNINYVFLFHRICSVDPKQFDKSDCQKISIVYDEYSYTICLSNKKIYIVKRLNRSQRRSNSLQTPELTTSPLGQFPEGVDQQLSAIGDKNELS